MSIRRPVGGGGHGHGRPAVLARLKDDRGAQRPVRPRPGADTQLLHVNMPRLQTVVGRFVAALLAAMIALGSSRQSPADDPPASPADDFSPYVTGEGGISLPTDYREKFL